MGRDRAGAPHRRPARSSTRALARDWKGTASRCCARSPLTPGGAPARSFTRLGGDPAAPCDADASGRSARRGRRFLQWSGLGSPPRRAPRRLEIAAAAKLEAGASNVSTTWGRASNFQVKPAAGTGPPKPAFTPGVQISPTNHLHVATQSASYMAILRVARPSLRGSARWRRTIEMGRRDGLGEVAAGRRTETWRRRAAVAVIVRGNHDRRYERMS